MLETLVGTFAVTMRTHGPGGDVTEGQGLLARKGWFGDGRYVREEVAGEFAGSRHEKMTLLAFNGTLGIFQYLTADNHDTVLLLYESRPEVPFDGRTVSLYAPYVSPGDAAARGVRLTVRTELRFEGREGHTLRNFYRAPGEDERLFLEYTYRRTG